MSKANRACKLMVFPKTSQKPMLVKLLESRRKLLECLGKIEDSIKEHENLWIDGWDKGYEPSEDVCREESDSPPAS